MKISVSYMEIYKEEAYDLLVDRDSVRPYSPCGHKIRMLTFIAKAPKLPIREDASGQVFVAHLSSIPISSISDFDRIYS